MSVLKEFNEEFFGKKVGMIVTIFVIFYLLVAFLSGIFPFNIVKKATNPNKIISNYEWYYDTYNQIKSIDIQISEAEISLKTLTLDTEIYNRSIIELNGLKRMRLNYISEYNSKSKQITRNLWKSNDLPYQINLKGEY